MTITTPLTLSLFKISTISDFKQLLESLKRNLKKIVSNKLVVLSKLISEAKQFSKLIVYHYQIQLDNKIVTRLNMEEFRETNPQEAQIAQDTLERYSGSDVNQFGSYLLLTNFSRYIRSCAETFQVPVLEGSMFRCAHLPTMDISIVDFKLGSAAAALIVDLCSFLPNIKAALMLGMCGGLRKHYNIGDYFLPIAGIRGEGTSDFYFPSEVPALANFLMQKAATQVLDELKIPYHIGITHTTNIRFWEFNEAFKDKLRETKAQAIEMECATLFASSYRRKLPLGALLLISDLPLTKEGIKTKKSSQYVFDTYTADHIDKGIKTIEAMKLLQAQRAKGAFRGDVRHTDM